jgi:sucrose-6-phosphate hydrolase SacC (GH32 family)
MTHTISVSLSIQSSGTVLSWPWGGTWTQLGQVTMNGVTLSDSQEPNVIYDSNPQILTGNTYVFKMWWRNGWSGPGCTVYYAESTDGITWTSYSGNPVIDYDGYQECPYVFKYANEYYCYVRYNGNGIMRFHSADGIHWVNDGVVVTGYAFGNNCVWVENPTDWRMIYEYQLPSTTWALGYMTSSNGLTWTDHGQVVGTVGDPDTMGGAGGPMVVDSGNPSYPYYLFFHAGGNPTDIWEAESTNCLTWIMYSGNPIIARTEPWEASQVADPTVAMAQGKIWMWFDALSAQNAASCSLGIAVWSAS